MRRYAAKIFDYTGIIVGTWKTNASGEYLLGYDLRAREVLRTLNVAEPYRLIFFANFSEVATEDLVQINYGATGTFAQDI